MTSTLIKDETRYWQQTIVLDGRRWYLLWQEAEDGDTPETFVTLPGSRLLVGDSRESLYVASASVGIVSSMIDSDTYEEALVNFDEVLLLTAQSPVASAYSSILDGWNLIDSALESVGDRLGFDGAIARRAYEKLFWGCNIESVTPHGEHFVPAWRAKEWRKIHQVLSEGSARLRRLLVK